MERISEVLNFRKNHKVKIISNILTILVFSYALVLMILISLHKSVDYYTFSLIPLFFLISFLRMNDPIILIGEFITIFGDVALMIYHNQPIGFTIYLFVQLTYATYFYLYDENKKRKLILLIIRIVVSIITPLILIPVFKNSYSYEYAVGAIYIINLLVNLIYAIIVKNYILLIGFAFFILSDSVIGLKILLPESSQFYKFLDSFNFIHFLYVPSQALIIFNREKIDYSKLKNKNN